MQEALYKLVDQNIEFVMFGSSKPNEPINFGVKTNYLGKLHDDISLVTLYSAVYVTVVPSLQENLSNTIMESLACGTLVVAFDVGGNSDLIDHKKNGYLAKPLDSTDLANGINWIIENGEKFNLSENARNKVSTCFESKKVAKLYIKVYEEIIS